MFRAAYLVPVIMVLLLVSVGCKSMAEFQEPWLVYGGVGYQTFETMDGDDTLTEDQGAVAGAGVQWTLPTLLTRFRIEGLVGLGVERELKQGPNDGDKADNSYWGAKGEFALIYPLSLTGDDNKETSVLTPFIGTGVRYDHRDVDDFDNTVNDAQTEKWLTWYLNGGADWRWHVEEDMDLLVEAQFGYALNADLDIERSGGDIDDLGPRGGPRLRLVLGLDWGQYDLFLVYDYFRLLRSDTKDGFSYPRNETSTISLAFGWQF